MKVLFVCTANKLRSPTAEDVFKDYPGIEALSAGTGSESPRPLTKELVASADLIFAMETHHRESSTLRAKHDLMVKTDCPGEIVKLGSVAGNTRWSRMRGSSLPG